MADKKAGSSVCLAVTTVEKSVAKWAGKKVDCSAYMTAALKVMMWVARWAGYSAGWMAVYLASLKDSMRAVYWASPLVVAMDVCLVEQ